MTSPHPPLAIAAMVALVAGVGLMVPFEGTLTRIGGIVALASFVVCGLAAIAEPGFLAGDQEDDTR